MEKNQTDQADDLKSKANTANTAALFFFGVSMALLVINALLVMALFISLAWG